MVYKFLQFIKIFVNLRFISYNQAMEKFADILKARFGENEPILIEEIIATFPDISRQLPKA